MDPADPADLAARADEAHFYALREAGIGDTQGCITGKEASALSLCPALL
jgi:hypothetical protein